MGIKRLKKLYTDVTNFLNQQGGAYSSIDTDTYRDLIDALIEGRYRLVQSAGCIESFTSWWMVSEEDVGMVKSGGRPENVLDGDVCYIADQGGPCSRKDIALFVGDKAKAFCWHHRYKHEKQFRIYRRNHVKTRQDHE